MQVYRSYKWVALGLTLQGLGFLVRHPWITLLGVSVHLIGGLALVILPSGIRGFRLRASLGLAPLLIWLVATWISIPQILGVLEDQAAINSATGAFATLMILTMVYVWLVPPPNDEFFVRYRILLFAWPLFIVSAAYLVQLSMIVDPPTRFPYDWSGGVLASSVPFALAVGMARKPWAPKLHEWGIGGSPPDGSYNSEHDEQ